MMRLTWFRSVVLAALTAGCVANAEGDSANYDVSTEGTSTKVKAGEKGKVVISIAAKNGAHVSDEAPLRIELSSKESKLDKEKLALADSVGPKEVGPRSAVKFEVGFAPSAHGKTTVDAKMTFFICTEKLCSRQTKNLSLPVEVN